MSRKVKEAPPLKVVSDEPEEFIPPAGNDFPPDDFFAEEHHDPIIPEETALEKQLREQVEGKEMQGYAKAPPVIYEKGVVRTIVPEAKPWKKSGRLICQPFRIDEKSSSGIKITGAHNPDLIPTDVHCFVVAKDPEITTINVNDEVLFAKDFVPTSRWLGGVFYYIPHYLDVLLIIRDEVTKENNKLHKK
jgi:hypothetical protein